MNIDSITPDAALPDTPVLLNGTGLEAAYKLLFGEEPVPFKVNKTGTLEASVPSGSGTVDVTVELLHPSATQPGKRERSM